MDDYITKPVHIDALIGALKRAVAPVAPPALAGPPRPADAGCVLDTDILDTLRSLRQPDKPDPFAELVSLFIEEAPKRLREMELAIVRYEPSLLASLAHNLKGCSSTIGARHMAVLCSQIEEQAGAGAVQIAANVLRKLREEYACVEVALRKAESA